MSAKDYCFVCVLVGENFKFLSHNKSAVVVVVNIDVVVVVCC